eukprot:scaffold65545_cov56-Phaeocystis_antarctica.AAC.1
MYDTSGAYSARREGERHFYHALTSLIAANKRDYPPDAFTPLIHQTRNQNTRLVEFRCRASPHLPGTTNRPAQH